MSDPCDARDAKLPIPARDALVKLLLDSLREESAVRALEEALAVASGATIAADVSPRAQAALASVGLIPPDPFAARPAWHAVAQSRLDAYRRAVDAAPRGEELPTRLAQARVLFTAGLYFEVHEVLEPAWIHAHGEPRILLQGLIQAAAAWYHWTRDNPAGATTLVSAAAEKLAGGPAVWNGFPLATVRDAVREWSRWLESGRDGAAPALPFCAAGP